MADGVDKVTRFSSELVDAAAAQGEQEHRSTRQSHASSAATRSVRSYGPLGLPMN